MRELRGLGEEGDGDGVGVGVLGEGEDDELAVAVGEGDWLPGSGREEARCSRRSRCWRRAEDSSRASALRPDAARLDRSAFAWLGDAEREGSVPSWGYFLKPGANAAGKGTRLEKTPVLVPERYGSTPRPKPGGPAPRCAFGWAGDDRWREREKRM